VISGFLIKGEVIDLCLIILIALSTRALALYLLDTKPTSDFQFVNQLAVLLVQGQYVPINDFTYAIYHHNTALVYSLLYAIFGVSPAAIKLFNTLIAIATGVILYYSGKILTGGRALGFVAAAFYLFWPSMILYTQVLSAEHIFILVSSILLLLYIYFHVKFADMLTRLKLVHVGFYALLGILIALCEAFRPFGAIYLVALIMTDLIFGLKINNWRLSLVSIGLLTASVLGYFIFRRAPILLYERMNNVQYMDPKAVNVLIGLDFDTTGTYSIEDWNQANAVYAQTGRNQSEFTRAILDLAYHRLISHISQLPTLLRDKFHLLWSGDGGLSWAAAESNRFDAKTIYDLSLQLNRFYLLIITTFIALSFLKEYEGVHFRLIFFCILVIFGFNLLETFSEVQTRYTSVLLPLLSFVAAWSVTGNFRLQRLWKKHISK
jgi:hypothetical protein